ncbi:non-ribosomal peptide synthetase [Streptomyces rishiriensis]|uniref:non-ribosomal peptide synthetase n=1 Tax=Streptomyces rishiriensis TaxID=68264 RepID=UPI0033C3CE43
MTLGVDGEPSHAYDCHSLVLRLPSSVGTEDVQRIMGRVVPRMPEYRGLRLWETSSTSQSDRVQKEAARPIARSRATVRGVLVRHPDGSTDLVLVARRSQLGKADLTRLAVMLSGGAEPAPDTASSPPAPSAGQPTPPPPWPEVPWGLGERRCAGEIGTVRLNLAQGDAALLVAATVLTLSRYNGDREPGIGRVTGDALTIDSFTVDEREAVSNYLDRMARSAAKAQSQGEARAPVGVLFGELDETCEYRPCLAPMFPLTFYWEHRPDGSFRGRCWYDRGVVAPEIGDRFAQHIVQAADSLTTIAGERPLGDIDFMTSEEEEAILRSGVTLPTTPCAAPRIDQLFTEIVRKQPDSPAVSDTLDSLNYRELEALAESLAAGLHALGVSSGDRVGVCLERGVTLVATLLAVLKLGCAFVPMDVRHPKERQRYIAADSGVSTVVAEGEFPEVEGLRKVTPGELVLADGQSGDHIRGTLGDCPAYAIYTSGSTGHPKGVLVPHSNVTALIRAAEQELSFTADDVWTFFHSSAFDFSIWEIWGCLLTGGTLVVVPYWVSRSPEEFRELLARSHVTVLSQTPSAFGQLIEADLASSSSDVTRLRLVVLGGEPLDTRILLRWFSRHSHTACRIVNMFGITETTVHVTVRTVTPADTERGSKNVGHALPGWSVSVRDERGRILPYGAVGEIWVGGAGVAIGYLGRHELTAERFIEDDTTGLRFYRTGDRGRLRPDGSLDHLGRWDDQVNVRGHRIELDEIRSVLMASPLVLQAAVTHFNDPTSDAARTRIDAYAVLAPGGTTRAVLRHCRSVLPEYMIPATLTAVEALPLTINGKVDHTLLPPPTMGFMAQGEPLHGEGLADPVVEKVLESWSRHLHTNVGISDNFFELGGNSLLVVRVLAELRKMNLPEVTVQQFYRHSTAARFAALLRDLTPDY